MLHVLTFVIHWQILGQQPVGEFAKRHVYEQYQSNSAVSEKASKSIGM